MSKFLIVILVSFLYPDDLSNKTYDFFTEADSNYTIKCVEKKKEYISVDILVQKNKDDIRI